MAEKYLESIYLNPKSPAAFSGFDKLYRFVKKDNKFNITKKQLKEWLGKQDAYTSFRPVIRKYKRPRVVVARKDQEWMGDTCNMVKFAKYNDYSYFLVLIDVLSRFVWTFPLKSLKGKEMVQAVDTIFKDYKPNTLLTDKGSEFIGRDLKKFLQQEKIKHFTTTNEVKASLAERAIKSLKNRIVRYMEFKQNFKWDNILAEITESYNKTYHRSIKMSPEETRKTKNSTLWHIQYDPKMKKIKKERKSPPKLKSPFTLKVGDSVKISFLRNLFDREYDEKWTTEVFTVADRSLKQGIPVYTIKDYSGDIIDGKFYAKELQKVTMDENTVYKIEKILKHKTKSGQKYVLLKWKGWPDKFNSWILEKDVINYD